MAYKLRKYSFRLITIENIIVDEGAKGFYIQFYYCRNN